MLDSRVELQVVDGCLKELVGQRPWVEEHISFGKIIPVVAMQHLAAGGNYLFTVIRMFCRGRDDINRVSDVYLQIAHLKDRVVNLHQEVSVLGAPLLEGH